MCLPLYNLLTKKILLLPVVENRAGSWSLGSFFFLILNFIFILSKDNKKYAQDCGYFKVKNVLSSDKCSIQRSAFMFHSSIKTTLPLLLLGSAVGRLCGCVPSTGKGAWPISAVFSLSPLCVRHTRDRLGEGGENRGQDCQVLAWLITEPGIN